ncbi:MAG: hypothetical protein AAF587_22020 [Bacteroidota bacterium]
MKKIIKLLQPHFRTILRLLPKAMGLAVPLMVVYVMLIWLYNEIRLVDIAWGIWLAGFILSIVGFYISHFTSAGIKKWLAKEENEI